MLRLTPVVKNLLIINVVIYILQHLLKGLHFTEFIALWPIHSMYWKPYQFFTYMFGHSPNDFMHILFNMLGLIFLGPLLEQFWGSKRFLTFYIITGLGAGMIFGGVEYISNQKLINDYESFVIEPTSTNYMRFLDDNISFKETANGTPYEILFRMGYSKDAVLETADLLEKYPDNKNYQESAKSILKSKVDVEKNFGSMLGASGAIYGILMAFGLLFPNTQLMLLFPPIPIKAKYLVLGLGAYAIFNMINDNPEDNTAHLAHLGGMIFAFIMIQIWKNDRNRFY